MFPVTGGAAWPSGVVRLGEGMCDQGRTSSGGGRPMSGGAACRGAMLAGGAGA